MEDFEINILRRNGNWKKVKSKDLLLDTVDQNEVEYKPIEPKEKVPSKPLKEENFLNNINEVKSSWQKMISHVPQDVYYSDDSFSKNIAFGSELESINELKLIKASKDAQIYDYIMQQDDKFNHKFVRL